MKKAFVQLHVAIFLAGFTAIFGKLIELNEGMLVLYRMLLSAVILGVYMLLVKSTFQLSKSGLFRLVGVGSIVALHWVTFYGSIKYSNVSVAVTCLSAIGFFTSFIEPAIVRRKIDLMEVALGLLVIGGIYCIFNFYPEYVKGMVFGLLSAFFASIFPIVNKLLLKKHSANSVTFYEMLGGFLVLCLVVPVYLLYFEAPRVVPRPVDWLWLVILALFCTVISFILSLNSLKHISAFTANLSYNLEPVYSIILAFILFKEHKFLGTGFYLGFALIVLAVVLQMLREWQHRKKAGNRISRSIEIDNIAV